MNTTNLSFDLTVEILYSYIYEKDMTFDKIDKYFSLPNGTSESILSMCNIFRFCGFRIAQGKRNIPIKSIYKLARINNNDVATLLNSHNYFEQINKASLKKVINDRKYSRDIKNAFIKCLYKNSFWF